MSGKQQYFDVTKLFGSDAESRSMLIEFRADSENKTIEGYAARFDTLSENLGGFREKIAPGAFDEVLNDDVRALYNHDANQILGRNKADTLELKIDENGLRYKVILPNTTFANDLIESMQRGDVNQSSFAFSVDEADWDEDEDGRVVRTIKKVKRLYDVSPVVYPAYTDTSVAQRSLANHKSEDIEQAEKRQIAHDSRERELDLITAQA